MTVINTVYVLFNTNRNKIYIGRTMNLEKRIKRHNNLLPTKKTSYTSKNSGHWIVAYEERTNNPQVATLRERWMKSGIGREYIKKNLAIWLSKRRGALKAVNKDRP